MASGARVMPDAGQPLVGWRLWRLRDGRLRSWAVDHDWAPGHNEARCLPPPPVLLVRKPCERSPGTGCRCGLWALWDLRSCVRKARCETDRWDRRAAVVGLVAGWGTTAIHGEEGFRSQYGAVRCLFTDAVSDPPAGRGGRLWARLTGAKGAGGEDERRTASLRAAAERYAVPLLSLRDALRLGVLAELGVPDGRLDDVAAALAAG